MHLEALKLEQREVLPLIRQFNNFYLVEGTALALQIGHRFSEDFDLFREKPLDKLFIAKVYRIFKGRKVEIRLRHSEQVNLKVNEIKFHFVKYKYRLIFKIIEENGIRMAEPREVALMKAFSMGQRATLKDYIDLYFIIKNGLIDLENIISLAEKKFGDEFNGRLFLEQLTYLSDLREVQEMPIEFLKEKLSRKQMVDFFQKEIAKIKL